MRNSTKFNARPQSLGVLFLGCALCLLRAGSSHAKIQWAELPLADGEPLHYALVLPDDFQEDRLYPVLLALPPGNQDKRMVQAGLSRYWGEPAAARGWIVASPAAVNGQSFFQGSEAHIPALLEQLRAQFQLEGGGFHLAGVSNGGRSAFRIAVRQPEDFLSLLAVPGYPPAEEDREQLKRLIKLPMYLAAGGEDVQWVREMRTTQAQLRDLGGTVELKVFEGEGHVPPSLDGGALMDRLEALRTTVLSNHQGDSPASVLDDFHKAASEAEGERYFSHFTDDAVFLGTDPNERWSVAEFRAYAEPHFSKGNGWTYTVLSRHVFISDDGRLAWFDEELDNTSYGHCRGTGVLVRVGDAWKIAQYNLSVPVPNDLAKGLVEQIRAAQDRD